MSVARRLIEHVAEAYFQVGDFLKANADVQGMKKGTTYQVVDLNHGPFGVVQYQIQTPDEKTLWIGNAHLVTTKVK